MKTPHEIQEGARTASRYGIPGYVPSFESFSFEVKHPEGNEQYLIGSRLKPFGFAWLPDGKNPYGELLVRVNRFAYREFTHNPELDYNSFRSILGKEIFGRETESAAVDDLLFLQQAFFKDHTWFSASPVVSPDILRGRLETGTISFEQMKVYRDNLDRIRAIATRYASANGDAKVELKTIAEAVLQNWRKNDHLISDHLR
jgi:hypothetical protein